jgi:hypothetical protein
MDDLPGDNDILLSGGDAEVAVTGDGDEVGVLPWGKGRSTPEETREPKSL